MKAQELLQSIDGMSASESRDKLIVSALKNGGLRQWAWADVPVLDKGGQVVGSFRAQVDYVSCGDESDWVRVPMGGHAAQAVADFAGAVLPSAYMVHLIWTAATVKLRPITFPQPGMTTTKRFVEHHERIEKQRDGRAGLIAGIKKDTIVSNKLVKKPDATCIFGWHHPNGQIIQPISTAHNQRWYSDYSHGVRLVAPEMQLFGEKCNVQDVLRDPARAQVLTGSAAWLAKYDGRGDEVLQVVRYGAPVVAQVPANYTPANDTTSSRAGTLGERALRWCVGELDAGVKEEPLGSNRGPRIAQYFKQARRRATGALLGIQSGDWCAVGQCAALSSVAEIGAYVPHGYRAAVWELREDAKVTGAWANADDVRSGKVIPQIGDLAVWTRGAGLGHVSRIETPPSSSSGEMVTIGANEGDGRWLRRTRSIHEPTFEGIIRYNDFRPLLKLEESNSNLAAVSASEAHAPGQNDEAWAQRIFLTAWAREFDRPPTPQEKQTILAIARHERHFGLADKPAAGRGKHNWGGVQCSAKTHGDECYPGNDKDLQGVTYPARFKIYKTDEDGAQHLIQLVTKRRPHVHEAMRRGDLFAVAREMGTRRVIDGKTYYAYHQTPVDTYYKALRSNARIIAKNLHEPLAVDGEASATSMPLAPARVQILPAMATTNTSRMQPSRSRTQDGIRALVRSRAPGLERVVVGAGPLSNVLLQDVAETLGILPPNTSPLSVVTGVGTSTTVKDYAQRVDNYIRVLHTIIQEEMNKRPQPDGFPWNEWAAFRATWSETYFQIMHSIIPNFDDGVVRTYDVLSRQWAEVVKGHYGRSPEQPLLDPPTPMAAKALWAVTGLAAAGMLVYAMTSTRR
jgi:hypothetical protein